MASSSERVTCADAEKVDSVKVVTGVRWDSEQHLVRFNVTLFGHSRAEKLTCLSVTESSSAVGAVAQQLGYGAVSRLQYDLKSA